MIHVIEIDVCVFKLVYTNKGYLKQRNKFEHLNIKTINVYG